MFLLECRGANGANGANALNEENLSKCALTRRNEADENNQHYEEICLFERPYHLGSALSDHCEDLFGFARKYFEFLNRAARNDALPTVYDKYSDYIFLRESVVEFFFRLQNATDEADDSIRDRLTSFRLMMGPSDSIPDYIIQNCSSDSGNQCQLASFHLFHLYLEMCWLHFIAVLKLSLKDTTATGRPPDTDTELIPPDEASNLHPTIEKEIAWTLHNLVSLVNKSSEKSKFKVIFPCPCVKPIWSALRSTIDNLSKENKCASFWHHFNEIIKNYILPSQSNTKQTFNSNELYKMNPIGSSKPMEFSLCLLLKVARLQNHETNENQMDFWQKPPSNFELLEHVIKIVVQTDRPVPEEELRSMMKRIVQLMKIWPEPKNEVVTLLWEYFHKRLNCAFSISGMDDPSNLIHNFSIRDTISDLKSSCDSLNDSRLQYLKTENSFYLFTSLMAMHLKNCTTNNLPSLCQKIKGRILPKFTINKIISFNEYGLKHFSAVFLAIACATNLNDMCDKLQSLLLQLPFNELQWNKKYIVMKTHLIILWLYVDAGISMKTAAQPIKNILLPFSGSRCSESMQFIKMILNGCLEILDSSTTFQNDEYVLIDTWISKYLTVCNINDIYGALDGFSTLISKLQIICTYQMEFSKSINGMIYAVFTHIFSCVKTLYFNGTSALQIADLIYNFVKFVMDSNTVAEKYGSFETYLKCFLDTKESNERVSRRFIMLLLQDDCIFQRIENENRSCQSLIINSWIKSSLVSSEACTDDDTHLMLLISQLGEFSSLNITPSCGDGQQNLCKLFYALRQAWDKIEDLYERINFKRRVNIYLNGIDKQMAIIVKTPTTQDSAMQIFITIGTLFLHCSPIIYTRSDPSCLLHLFISSVILPPQLFMEKKIHPYVSSGICKSWYMFMKGLHQLDYRNDTYIGKAMKDMILQYLPFFTETVVLTRDKPFNVVHRMIPDKCSADLTLEKYILENISTSFITCRGKQSHAHSTKALSILLHLCNNSKINLIFLIISTTLISVFEQLMFSDTTSHNRKIAIQILNSLSDGNRHEDSTKIKCEIEEILTKICQKHLAFNSASFFKLATQVSPILGKAHINTFLTSLKLEIAKVEKMRGVGYDKGLRAGLGEIETSIANIL